MVAIDSNASAGSLTVTGTSVELVDVVKTYSGHAALSGLDLKVEPGEFVALLGPSGCGKTTALRALSGLEGIDSGSIRIGGVDVVDVPVNRRDIGMVFQSYSLFPHMTAQQNVEFGLRMRKVPAQQRRARASEALELVGLGHLSGRYAHELSGGQQQRVALARALVTRPRVLLLDEPLSALDAKVRVQLREEIRRLQQELGITTIFVTHDQEEALAVADRVAVMNAGDIEQIGTPEELYLAPRTPFVADFVGLSNKLGGTLVGGVVTVYGQPLNVLGEAPEDGPVTAYVRPEDVIITTDAGLPATVVSTSFLGSLRRTFVRLADDTVVAVQHDVSDRPEPGQQVALRFKGRPVAVTRQG
ncbi:ABC transporter ATP-binding protein [Gryllotalpicola ginsengisoli]|uniref:ABC transporter ATP-binding protein n=1 Tax=Gryllotalpicola ginsengisoli TaxID=444608 RepID=UPI0003B6C42F|nr:ABC transporter ATP-binding protein [Gryllotalpicola ginsengisoli]